MANRMSNEDVLRRRLDGSAEGLRTTANFHDELVRFATESFEALHRYARLVENVKTDLLYGIVVMQEALQTLAKIVDTRNPAFLAVRTV